MSNKTDYKTSKKYKCPYCDFKALRNDLIDHVERKHNELLPENYNAARAIYDNINGKNYGICMICKKKVYKWNDKIHKYYNLCDNPECKAKVREVALKRHMKVYNKPTLLNDPEQQEKMLANRRISGSYKFTDGGVLTYTGKYERNALEFMDKVLNIPSRDIQTPGPVLEYEYNGKKHKWITDIYYIPANLLIEIKDGGSNPNNRPMQSYRDKQIAKETMITNLGTFNYIRLTNNDFSQLLNIFADMKNESLNNDNPKVSIHINEEVGGLPPNRPPEAYIIPYGMNNVFNGFAYSDSTMGDKIAVVNGNYEINQLDEKTFNNKYALGPRLLYKSEDIREKIESVHRYLNDNTSKKNCLFFGEILIGKKMSNYKEILLSEKFKYYDKDRESRICKLIENGVLVESQFGFNDTNIVKTVGNVCICQSPNGYYAATQSKFYMASEYFSDLESLLASDVIQLMNDIYDKNYKGEGGSEEDD